VFERPRSLCSLGARSLARPACLSRYYRQFAIFFFFIFFVIAIVAVAVAVAVAAAAVTAAAQVDLTGKDNRP